MNIAFYAPMKPPNAAVPSGDRRMALSLMRALEAAGHRVELASVFQSRDGAGDAGRQRRLGETGRRLAERLVRRYRRRPARHRPDAWFTYHLYYKAPDWLGPAVCDGLGIAYVVAEASHAPKRAGGPWDFSHRAAAKAIARADIIFGLNSNDAACVRPLLDDPAKLVPLKPFLDAPPGSAPRAPCRAELAGRFGLDRGKPWLLTVAMMRGRDKLESYRILGAALDRLHDLDWQILVVGDGPVRDRVERAIARENAVFLGFQPEAELIKIRAAADLFIWPAVNEAYGMALLEAQAAGLAVVAGRGGGVGDIVGDGETGLLVDPGDAGAFAAAVSRLLGDAPLRQALGERAAEIMARDHGLDAAAKILGGALSGVVK